MDDSQPKQPAQQQPGQQQECTACKLWAQASSAFRHPAPASKPGDAVQAQPQTGAGGPPPEQGGLHAIPGHDCMACRVSGSAVSLGCSAFLFSQLCRKPAPTGAHKAAILVVGGGFAVLGLLRAAV
jgi:hypothetical protein